MDYFGVYTININTVRAFTRRSTTRQQEHKRGYNLTLVTRDVTVSAAWRGSRFR